MTTATETIKPSGSELKLMLLGIVLLTLAVVINAYRQSKAEKIEAFANHIQLKQADAAIYGLNYLLRSDTAALRSSKTYVLTNGLASSTIRHNPFTGVSTPVLFGVGGGFEKPEHDITHFRFIYNNQGEVTIEIDKTQLDPDVCAMFAPSVLRCIAWPPKDADASKEEGRASAQPLLKSDI